MKSSQKFLEANFLPVVVPRYRSHATYALNTRFELFPDRRDLTEPNHGLSIQDILSRFTRGQSVNGVKVVNVESDLSALDKMNRFELIEYQRSLDAQLKARRAVLDELKESKRKADSEAADLKRIDDEVAKRLAKVEQPKD